MALEKKGSTVYGNISDLPLLGGIRDGDMFIVQTTSGTRRFDYKSLLIPLSKTTFQTTFNEMSELYSNSNDLLNKIGQDTITVTGLNADNATLTDAVNTLSDTIDNLHEIPVGTIITRMNATSAEDYADSGFIMMKGQTVSKTKYSELYDHLLNLGLISSSSTDKFIMPTCSSTITINFSSPSGTSKTGYYYIKY